MSQGEIRSFRRAARFSFFLFFFFSFFLFFSGHSRPHFRLLSVFIYIFPAKCGTEEKEREKHVEHPRTGIVHHLVAQRTRSLFFRATDSNCPPSIRIVDIAEKTSLPPFTNRDDLSTLGTARGDPRRVIRAEIKIPASGLVARASCTMIYACTDGSTTVEPRS